MTTTTATTYSSWCAGRSTRSSRRSTVITSRPESRWTYNVSTIYAIIPRSSSRSSCRPFLPAIFPVSGFRFALVSFLRLILCRQFDRFPPNPQNEHHFEHLLTSSRSVVWQRTTVCCNSVHIHARRQK